MIAKRCKLCGGEPKYVHYAVPKQDYPDGWYESADGFDEPYVLFKRLECSKCGAMVKILEDCICDDCGIKCCGEEMKVLVPNSVDATAEKPVQSQTSVTTRASPAGSGSINPIWKAWSSPPHGTRNTTSTTTRKSTA